MENPYRHRSGTLAHYQGKIGKYLAEVGASQIMFCQDRPMVAFMLNGLPFQISQPIEPLVERFGETERKAVKQAWALLQEYVCSMISRAVINADSETNLWRFLTPHLLLADGRSIESEIADKIESGHSGLLLASAQVDR